MKRNALDRQQHRHIKAANIWSNDIVVQKPKATLALDKHPHLNHYTRLVILIWKETHDKQTTKAH